MESFGLRKMLSAKFGKILDTHVLTQEDVDKMIISKNSDDPNHERFVNEIESCNKSYKEKIKCIDSAELSMLAAVNFLRNDSSEVGVDIADINLHKQLNIIGLPGLMDTKLFSDIDSNPQFKSNNRQYQKVTKSKRAERAPWILAEEKEELDNEVQRFQAKVRQ
ncbi:hypothetical protein Ciccas_007209 [Cichlidogyrus casuarinus]|uniref:Uncharacterized protein n=1 Tax=Cichlidogyrus casuarinus TaxID=1844966 RepID=A0ABD2Q3I3_9PLAT